MNIRDFQQPPRRQFSPTVLEQDGDFQVTIKAAKVLAPVGKPPGLLLAFTLAGGQELTKYISLAPATPKAKHFCDAMREKLAVAAGLTRFPDDPALLVGRLVTVRTKTGPWYKDPQQESTEIIGFSPAQAPPSSPSQAIATGDDLDAMPF